LPNAAHERVRATLGAKRATLEAVAKRLIQQEVVDRAADRRRAATRAREALGPR
jgi:hypothetical protein